MADALSIIERAKLENLEIVIAGGLQSFVDVGQALMQIRDGRLYRIQFGTFEDYCQDRWSFGRNYVNKIIAASDVVSSLGTHVPKPATEGHARPLTRLPPEEQPAAWREAVATAPNGKVTAKHVEAVVARKLESPTDGSVTLQSHDETDDESDSSKRDTPRNGAIKTDAEKLIERVEQLVEFVNRMAAHQMGHNKHSTAVVEHLKGTLPLVKAMQKSWRNR